MDYVFVYLDEITMVSHLQQTYINPALYLMTLIPETLLELDLKGGNAFSKSITFQTIAISLGEIELLF